MSVTMLPDSGGDLTYFKVAQKGDIVVGVRPGAVIYHDKTIIGFRVHVQYAPGIPGSGEDAIKEFPGIKPYAVREKYAAAAAWVEINRSIAQVMEVVSGADAVVRELLYRLENDLLVVIAQVVKEACVEKISTMLTEGIGPVIDEPFKATYFDTATAVDLKNKAYGFIPADGGSSKEK